MSTSRQIQQTRHWVTVAKKAPFWAVINFLGFFLVFIDFKLSFFLYALEGLLLLNSLRLIFESFLMVVFIVNWIYNIYYYVWLVRLMQPLELTEMEYRLFGIGEKEIGFKLKNPLTTSDDKSPVGKRSPPNYPPTPSFEISNSSIIDRHSSLDSTALSNRLFDSSFDGTKSSNLWSFGRFGGDGTSSLNNSIGSNKSGSDYRMFKTNGSTSGSNLIRRRKTNIASPEELQNYLHKFEERTGEINDLIQAEKRFNSMIQTTPTTLSPPHAPPSTPVTSVMNNLNSPNGSSFYNNSLSSFASRNLSFNDSFNNSLNNSFRGSPSKVDSSAGRPMITTAVSPPASTSTTDLMFSYLPAITLTSIPSPESLTTDLNIYPNKGVEKILTKLEVDNAKLNQMVENIRKWISQTILVRLMSEIQANNQTIKERGYLNSLIGETSIQQLKHLAETKKMELPTLEQVCLFLDINVRNIDNSITLQKYLVRRIRDLSQGGCMTQFFWDGGGSYNYKHWREDMITDSELILHLFCVYMDSRLLFNPTSPEGKPFTSQHFKGYKSSIEPKSNIYIEQTKSYLPHYSLVLKGEKFEIPSGRNNLFYALLVFLHHIKVKNFGLLGRINLGPSGLNISWVIDK